MFERASVTGWRSTGKGEPGDTRAITYSELLDEVSRFSNVLRSLGVGRGDRVNIYLPMIPEAAVAMLACARIGAVHSVVFGGFSSQSLIDRINDAEAKMLITADGGYRRGEVFPLKPAADEALGSTPTIENVVVVRRGGNEVDMVEGRDHWYHDLMEGASADCPPEPMESEDLLFLLYTSGTTGKPKGIMHTTGGYLTHATYTHRYVFDLRPRATSTGAPPTSAGSPVTPTSSTGRSRTDARRSCTRGFRTIPATTGSGTSSSDTASRSSTPLRPRSGRS